MTSFLFTFVNKNVGISVYYSFNAISYKLSMKENILSDVKKNFHRE